MKVNRILRVKSLEEREKAKELFEVRSQIERVEDEIKRLDREVMRLNLEIPNSEEPEKLIHRQKALIGRIQQLRQKLRELQEAETKSEDLLREAKRETKSLEIYKDKLRYEEYQKSVKREFMEHNFLFMIKRFLVLILALSLPVYAQSALQKKMLSDEEKKKEERIKTLLSDIDQKLKKIIEERKKLEALKAKPLTQEQQEKVNKLIKVISKTPSDEAGAILNNLEPQVAAEILLQLKERQAGQILAAMDPTKAAQVARIVMERKKTSK